MSHTVTQVLSTSGTICFLLIGAHTSIKQSVGDWSALRVLTVEIL